MKNFLQAESEISHADFEYFDDVIAHEHSLGQINSQEQDNNFVQGDLSIVHNSNQRLTDITYFDESIQHERALDL